MLKKITVLLIGLLFLLLAACTPIESDENENLTVLATTSIVADVVQNIAAEHLEVFVLLPNGSDPHGFVPTPQDLVKMISADLVFTSGLGLEESLNDFLTTNVETSSIVVLSEGMQLAGSNDPHVWMNPQNVIAWTERISIELALLDAPNADAYQKNAKNYAAQLSELDVWTKAQFAGIDPDERLLLSDHEVLTHLAQRYDIQIVGTLISGVSSLGDASALDLAYLEDRVKQLELSALFIASPESEELAAQFTLDTGIDLVSLFVESLSAIEGPAPTYLELMRYDVGLIIKTLYKE